ncbi:MAG TPA: MFS transporter [Candidatus Angelobacter sp.]|nr:MFS transporter [Candidatus Angelobacter sp.]
MSRFQVDQEVAAPPRPHLSRALLWLITVASAVAVANLYYNQPMLAAMARSFHSDPHGIGLVATFTQAGYALGMPIFIPLGDLVERRRLVVSLFLAVAVALAGAALAPNLGLLVLASFFIGLTTLIAQIMIPLGAELSAPEEQGKTIGSILSGILLGILLARTLSGSVAAHLGWRAMYWIACGMALVFAVLLRVRLPQVLPHSQLTYGRLIQSLVRLVIETPKLRQVSLVGAMLFAAFSAFWTTLVFLLETPPYHYGSQAAGLFGLIGATGALVAPISGRTSDRRGPRFVVAIALSVVLVAYACFWIFGLHLIGLIIGVIVLDGGVQAAQVANQSRVFSLRPDARNRVNTIYMICYFGGGSLGSLLGAWAWTHWHWNGVCAVAVSFIVVGILIFLRRVPDAAGVIAR